MDIMETYPKVIAEPLADNQQENPLSYFLFNSQTNRGYSVDGLAALFCRQLDGQKKLRDLITDFEAQHELEKGKFDGDIKTLLKDLEDNGLLVLNNSSTEG